MDHNLNGVNYLKHSRAPYSHQRIMINLKYILFNVWVNKTRDSWKINYSNKAIYWKNYKLVSKKKKKCNLM